MLILIVQYIFIYFSLRRRDVMTYERMAEMCCLGRKMLEPGVRCPRARTGVARTCVSRHDVVTIRPPPGPRRVVVDTRESRARLGRNTHFSRTRAGRRFCRRRRRRLWPSLATWIGYRTVVSVLLLCRFPTVNRRRHRHRLTILSLSVTRRIHRHHRPPVPAPRPT